MCEWIKTKKGIFEVPSVFLETEIEKRYPLFKVQYFWIYKDYI